MRMSLLDRSRVRAGESDAEAITATMDRAQRADQLGFHRFWVAEHHGVPGVAGGAPYVLLAAIGARTSTIRIGTGGVMLPNHPPLIVAEQALILEALYPGRVDLGVGASLGFTAPVRRALGRSTLESGQYASMVKSLHDYLHGRSEVTARPAQSAPPVWQLATGDGLVLAAQLGLPVVIGGKLLHQPEKLQTYLRHFQPSESAAEPYVIVSVDVAISTSLEHARHLLLPEAWAMATSREIGEFRPLQPLDEVKQQMVRASSKKLDRISGILEAAVTGTAEQVADSLRDLTTKLGAHEVMAWTSIHDHGELAASDRALADIAHS